MVTDSVEHELPETGREAKGVREPHFRRRFWGYDRAQVDAFVERTARRLSDALAGREPDRAVQEALDRVGEETSAVLRRAHQIADELKTRARQEAKERRQDAEQFAAEVMARSRQEAEERLQRAEEDAAALRRQAEHDAAALRRDSELRITELDAEIDALWQERKRLLDDIERVSQQLHALVVDADSRFPAEEELTEEVEEAPGAVLAQDAEAADAAGEGAEDVIAGEAEADLTPIEEQEETAAVPPPEDTLPAEAEPETPGAVPAEAERETPGAVPARSDGTGGQDGGPAGPRSGAA